MAMDVDNARPLAKEAMEGFLKRWIPVQNVGVRTVDCIQADVVLQEPVREPLWTRVITRTVDDVCDVHLGRKPLC